MTLDSTVPQHIKVDPIFIAQQFERINTTLEFFGKQLEGVIVKEKEQDTFIQSMRTDIAQMKNDLRALKEANQEQRQDQKEKRIPWTAVGALIASIVAIALSVLDKLYG